MTKYFVQRCQSIYVYNLWCVSVMCVYVLCRLWVSCISCQYSSQDLWWSMYKTNTHNCLLRAITSEPLSLSLSQTYTHSSSSSEGDDGEREDDGRVPPPPDPPPSKCVFPAHSLDLSDLSLQAPPTFPAPKTLLQLSPTHTLNPHQYHTCTGLCSQVLQAGQLTLDSISVK